MSLAEESPEVFVRFATWIYHYRIDERATDKDRSIPTDNVCSVGHVLHAPFPERCHRRREAHYSALLCQAASLSLGQ